MTRVLVSLIRPNPVQPRKTLDPEALRELSDSMREGGQIQPITVEREGDVYTLVDGERRWRAAQMAGLTHIDAHVRRRTNHNNQDRLLDALVANLQRENMNPMDEAEAYGRLRDEYGMSPAAIARRVGKAASVIHNALQLLKLDLEIQQLERERKIWKDSEFVRALLDIPTSSARVSLARTVVDKNMSLASSKASARRLAAFMKATPLSKTDSPALTLASKRSGHDMSVEPPNWDALHQLGSVPPWETVRKAALDTCANCSLRSVASEATCGECPAVDMLRILVRS